MQDLSCTWSYVAAGYARFLHLFSLCCTTREPLFTEMSASFVHVYSFASVLHVEMLLWHNCICDGFVPSTDHCFIESSIWSIFIVTFRHTVNGSVDRGLRFSDYFRLMLTHVGLPNWQYAFTPHGLDPTARSWLRFLSPGSVVTITSVCNFHVCAKFCSNLFCEPQCQKQERFVCVKKLKARLEV